MQFNDVEVVYQQLVSIVHNIVSQSVPTKTVKLGPKDPPFVTPVVKLLLKKRSRLCRRGCHNDADELSLRIKGMITVNRADSLQKLSNATSKQLWTAVNKTRNSTIGMLHQGCYEILILLMPILPGLPSRTDMITENMIVFVTKMNYMYKILRC